MTPTVFQDNSGNSLTALQSPALRLDAPMHPALNLFYPMNEFYKQAGAPLPQVVQVAPNDVPEPYRSLLVHDRDMTPTLAEAYQRTMQLRVLNRILRDDVYAREIILRIEGNGRAVVYAAIKIYLDRFPAEARRLILENKQPFGTILSGQGIVHSSRPEAYIQIVADDVINHALGLTGRAVLYGRRSALWNASQVPLAQVFEIVPPSI